MLRELHRVKASRNFVFPSVRGDDRPIARSTLNQAVKALGLEVEHFVLHDFRRTASTHLREIAQREDALADASALAAESPRPEDNTADQRRNLQSWADFVDRQIEAGRQAASGTV
jgi:integrase